MKKYYAVGAAVGVIVLVGVAYTLGARNAGQERQWPAEELGALEEDDEAAVPAGWTTYRSDTFGFSVSYPTEGFQAQENLTPANDGTSRFSFVIYPLPPAKEFGPQVSIFDAGPKPTQGLEGYARELFGDSLIETERVFLGDDEWLKVRATDDVVIEGEFSARYYATRGDRLLGINYTDYGLVAGGVDAGEQTLAKIVQTVDIFSPSGRTSAPATYENSFRFSGSSVSLDEALGFSLETDSPRFAEFRTDVRCPEGVTARLSGPWDKNDDLCDQETAFFEPKVSGEIVFEGAPTNSEVEIVVSMLDSQGVRLGSVSFAYVTLLPAKIDVEDTLTNWCQAGRVAFKCDPSWVVAETVDGNVRITNVGPEHDDYITLTRVAAENYTDSDAKFGPVTYRYDDSWEAWPWRTSGYSERDVAAEEGPAEVLFFTEVNGLNVGRPVFHGTVRWLTYVVGMAPDEFLVANISGSGYTEVLKPLVRSIIAVESGTQAGGGQ